MPARLDYLQDAHRNRNLVPVVGAGFSAGVAGLPTWPELVGAGMDYVRRELPGRVNTRQFRAMEAASRTGDLLRAFGFLQQLLAQSGREHFDSLPYQGFLNEIFHGATATSRALMDALRNLHPRVVLTTNYDTLLEEGSVTYGRQSATWLHPGSIRSLLRTGSGIVHLHGRYDIPDSVILSSRDYQRLVSDRDSVAVAQAAFHSGVLLFIGSSVVGLEDPHMSKILLEFARISDRTRGEDSPHVALIAGRLAGTEVAQLRRLGIDPVPYGDDHEDLPRFLARIIEQERITVDAHEVRSLAQAVGKAESKGSGLMHIAQFIQRVVFAGRDVRTTFCEKVVTGSQGVHLEARYVMPSNATRNIFNYPLSIAAWALIEGRIIAWPEDRATRCNFELVERLGRLGHVLDLLSSPGVESVPEISRYVDLARVRTAAVERRLTMGDFFQDWAAGQPDPRYDRFLSVPVPAVDSFGNRELVEEFGVFNIDSVGGGPLLDRRTDELLRLASSLATLVFRRVG